MAFATDTTPSGNRSGSGNQSSDCIPYSEWIQLPEEERNKILAKRKQERLENARRSQTSHPATHRAHTHNIETYIDLDSIIDNAIMNEEAEPNVDSEVPSGTTEGNNREFWQTHFSCNIYVISDGYRPGAHVLQEFCWHTRNSFLLRNRKVSHKRVTFYVMTQNFLYSIM
jgi:hypothetical protein